MIKHLASQQASIKTKVAWTVLATVTVLLFSISGSLFFYFHSLLKENIFSQQATLLTQIAEQIHGRIRLAQVELYLAAGSVNPGNINNPKALNHLLDDKEDHRLIFDEGFHIIGADGRLRAESTGTPELVGTDLTARDYVREGLQRGKPLISAPFRAGTGPHTAMIAMTTPIRDDGDHVIGLFVGYHSLGSGSFLTSIASSGMQKGYLYILDKRTLIMHPDPARLLEVISTGKNHGIDLAVCGFEGSLENVNSRGAHMLSSFKRIGNSNWILAGNIPVEVAFKPIKRLAVIVGAVTLLGLLLSIMLVWLVTRRLTRPIEQLTTHLDQAFHNAAEWTPISLDTGDELERLSQAFNSLMGEVRAGRTKLELDRDFFSGIIQNTSAPLFVIGQDHTILFWNNALAALTGMSPQQMQGTRRQWTPFYLQKRPVLADLVIDSNLDQIHEYYCKITPSKFVEGAFQAEQWFDFVGGQRRYLLFEAAPVFSASGSIIAAVQTLEDISERKLAQEALTGQNQFLQELLDAIPSPVYYKDSSGIYIGCNKAFLAFYGKSEAEIIGGTFADLETPEIVASSAAQDSTVLETGATSSYETTLTRIDGEIRNILVTKAPFYRSGGSIGGIVGAFVDMTEQFRIDEQMRKMSRAMEQSPATIVITDLDGAIEYVNPKFCQTTGYTRSEALGQNPRILKSGDLPSGAYAELWSTIASGKEWRGEFHNRRKDGSLYWEYASISPLYDKQGTMTGYLAVKENITARKEIEAELASNRAELEAKHRELEQMFELVARGKREWEETLDRLRDFVILTDADHLIRRSNKLLTECTGRHMKELIGVDWRSLLAESGFSDCSNITTGSELYNLRSGRTYDTCIYPITDNDTIIGYVVSLNDTTAVRAAAQELKKAYSELKDAQLRIFQQEKMVSIGQLAAGVAHEINNPMGFITSNLNTLSRYAERLIEFVGAVSRAVETGADSTSALQLRETRTRLKIDHILADTPQLISESQAGAERVCGIVRDLKSFSRVDQAETALVDLNEALETTINIAWSEINPVAVIEREFGDLPLITCFAQQLNQVFLNLLVNAAHALEGMRGTITVRTWCDTEHIYITVSDTGRGIPDDIRQRIFEPFFTTKQVGKGTGLGLSVSYDIVKKHHGEIIVDSRVAAGTTFTIRLPVEPLLQDEQQGDAVRILSSDAQAQTAGYLVQRQE